MKIFKKILRSKLFYLVLLLGVFLIPIFKFNLQAQELETVDYSNKNLAVSDLVDKEHLNDGNYRLYDNNGITLDYNVYNGIYILNGTINPGQNINIFIGYVSNWEQGETYTSSFKGLSIGSYIGDYVFEGFSINTGGIYGPYWSTGLSNVLKNGGTNIDTFSNHNNNSFNLRFYKSSSFDPITFVDWQFTLQIEKGDTATPYTVPLKPYLWHEKRLSYDEGYDDGFVNGFDDGTIMGYQDGKDYGQYLGYNEARDEYGIYINDEWISAVDYGDIQYNEARDEYGIYINDEWISATDYGVLQYNNGYQDGVNDTHDYYNDNGLFIPQLTPKGHLTVEEDLRYGDPHFYLQDFSGQYANDYFGFEHNRWLEKAFDWAYSLESDFLAINDVYIIQYKNDEFLYKYFYYKYDTDSIYFYSDGGTLMKIVERSNFDYYVHERPELSAEEQDRIDTAYDNGYNKAQRQYGIKVNDEYLTAKEYGEIQYNLGVISIRDKAYLDGFYTGMKDSHKYGFDWVRATYSDLIVESPILQNLRDETSFTYQLAHTQGFNEARGQYGYWNGRVWVTSEFVREETYTNAYNLGFRDATNNIYDDIYDEVYNQGYIAGQKLGMNNKFYTGLEKWLVPALIVVLFFGLLMLFPKNKED